MIAHWDTATMVLYIFMALVGGGCISKAKIWGQYSCRNKKLYYFLLYLIWVVMATWRVVGYRFGGTDAQYYVDYFTYIHTKSMYGLVSSVVMSHFDGNIGLYILYRIIGYFTSDYHVVFFISYSLLVIGFLAFIDEFAPNTICYSPFVLTFYLYLRGFNTLRSDMAIACLLLALVFYKRNKKLATTIFIILSLALHVSAALYILVFIIIFFRKNQYFYENGRLKWKFAVILTVVAFLFGSIAQNVMIGSFGQSLNGAYSAYAKRSLGTSFWDNFWTIAFTQLLLSGVLFVMRRRITNDIDFSKENDSSAFERTEKLNWVWNICMFDFISIPLTYVLGIWRGYEFLYLARLIMWGEVIEVIRTKFVFGKDKFKSDLMFGMLFVVVFIGWFIFRVSSTWSDSCLMPYWFELFH